MGGGRPAGSAERAGLGLRVGGLGRDRPRGLGFGLEPSSPGTRHWPSGMHLLDSRLFLSAPPLRVPLEVAV